MTRLSSIVGLLRPYRGMVAGAFGSMLVVALTTAAFAWLAGPLLRLLGVSVGHNPSLTLSIPGAAWTFTTANDVAIALSWVVIGLATVRGTAGYIQGFLVASLQQSVVRDLRAQVIESILFAEPSRHRGKPGDLATQVTADVHQIEAIISAVVAPALQNAVILATLLAFMVSSTPKLALIGFIVFPAAGALVWLASRAARRAFRASLDRRGKLAEALVEAFSSLEVIKAFRAEQTVTERLNTHVEDVRKLTLHARRIGLLLGPTVLVGGAVMIAIILTLGTGAVQSGELGAERFVSLLAALLFAYRPVQALGASVGVFAVGLAALDRLEARTAPERRRYDDR